MQKLLVLGLRGAGRGGRGGRWRRSPFRPRYPFNPIGPSSPFSPLMSFIPGRMMGGGPGGPGSPRLPAREQNAVCLLASGQVEGHGRRPPSRGCPGQRVWRGAELRGSTSPPVPTGPEGGARVSERGRGRYKRLASPMAPSPRELSADPRPQPLSNFRTPSSPWKGALCPSAVTPTDIMAKRARVSPTL